MLNTNQLFTSSALKMNMVIVVMAYIARMTERKMRIPLIISDLVKNPFFNKAI